MPDVTIKACGSARSTEILAVINEAAEAYRGVIPPTAGTTPTCRPSTCAARWRRACASSASTMAAASSAIRFYEKHGFRLVGREETVRLLRTYWDIPERQVETSVVLGDERARREIVRG